MSGATVETARLCLPRACEMKITSMRADPRKPDASRLPDAWDQAEANPARVLGVAGELLMERAILKRRADHEQDHRD